MLKDGPPSSGIRALQARLLAEEEAVPTAAARYYLTETDGDVRAAKAMHRASSPSDAASDDLPHTALARAHPPLHGGLPRGATADVKIGAARAWWRRCVCGGGGRV